MIFIFVAMCRNDVDFRILEVAAVADCEVFHLSERRLGLF